MIEQMGLLVSIMGKILNLYGKFKGFDSYVLSSLQTPNRFGLPDVTLCHSEGSGNAGVI